MVYEIEKKKPTSSRTSHNPRQASASSGGSMLAGRDFESQSPLAGGQQKQERVEPTEQMKSLSSIEENKEADKKEKRQGKKTKLHY